MINLIVLFVDNKYKFYFMTRLYYTPKTCIIAPKTCIIAPKTCIIAPKTCIITPFKPYVARISLIRKNVQKVQECTSIHLLWQFLHLWITF